MVLDFLPYKKPQGERKKLDFIRYIVFAAAFIFAAGLFLFKAGNIERIMFFSFLTGNILCYTVGIILAFVMKDNRAFCKRVCPMDVDVTDNSRKRKNVTECILCMECGVSGLF